MGGRVGGLQGNERQDKLIYSRRRQLQNPRAAKRSVVIQRIGAREGGQAQGPVGEAVEWCKVPEARSQKPGARARSQEPGAGLPQAGAAHWQRDIRARAIRDLSGKHPGKASRRRDGGGVERNSRTRGVESCAPAAPRVHQLPSYHATTPAVGALARRRVACMGQRSKVSTARCCGYLFLPAMSAMSARGKTHCLLPTVGYIDHRLPVVRGAAGKLVATLVTTDLPMRAPSLASDKPRLESCKKLVPWS